jgi:hypothetical protein
MAAGNRPDRQWRFHCRTTDPRDLAEDSIAYGTKGEDTLKEMARAPIADTLSVLRKMT